MNIVNLLITIIGVSLIFALFIISRRSQRTITTPSESTLPKIKDEHGNPFTSILEDIPAQDGLEGVIVKTNTTTVSNGANDSQLENTRSENANNDNQGKVDTKQFILFISSQDESGLDGNAILTALGKNDFTFGDMQIYHYLIDTNFNGSPSKVSLIRVANGTEPWTLNRSDLVNQKLAGLSIIMQIPDKVHKKQAMDTFITISEKLATSINGILKNQHQVPFTQKDKDYFLSEIR